MLGTDFLLVFVLAHLIGDFTLQTDKIAKYKTAGVKGLVIHAGIVGAVQVLLLSIFGVYGAAAGIVCAIIHFFIDSAKNTVSRYLSKMQFVLFAADQAVHMAVIWLIALMLAPRTTAVWEHLEIFRYLIAAVIIIYVATIAVQIFIRDLPLGLEKGIVLKKNERLYDIFTAACLWVLSLLLPIWGIPVIICAFYIYWRIQELLYKYSMKISLSKYVFFAVFVYVVNLALL